MMHLAISGRGRLIAGLDAMLEKDKRDLQIMTEFKQNQLSIINKS